jgi:hypothetical protein
MQVALWSIRDGQPVRLEPRRGFLEVDLEELGRTHPDLVVEESLWPVSRR